MWTTGPDGELESRLTSFEGDPLWPALARHLKADPEGNCAVGEFIHVDGARNIIYDNPY